MKASEQLQMDVVDELAYDPAVNSSTIAVTASEAGVVTLKGTVPTFMQARLAEKAAKRVHGVKGVANDLQVRPAPGYALDDTAIAEAALSALRASASVPRDAVTVLVSSGWITLDGKVDWDFQRNAAVDAVRDLRGIRGVTNLIKLTPQVQPKQIQEKIEAAFKRDAQLEAHSITAEVSGSDVTLRGTVASWAERESAERAAFAAPGVTTVENRLDVRAHAFA